MKITYAKKTVTVRFDEIKVDQCFIDTDGDVCLKVSRDFGYNVYSFGDKKLYEFYPDCDVVPVEVELIVHAEEP